VKRWQQFTACGLCTAFVAAAFFDTAAFVQNARLGLLLFGSAVLPVVFPFFFVSGLLVELLGNGQKHFRKTALMHWLLSSLAGFPTSARILSQMHKKGLITRAQALQMSTYTATTSPIFVIASVGTALFGSTRLGVLIFSAHLAGALATGILFSIISAARIPEGLRAADSAVQPAAARPSPPSVSDLVAASLHSAIQATLAIGGFIVVFFIAASALPLPLAAVTEMTTGVFLSADVSANVVVQTAITTAIISFGGLCLAMQGFLFTRGFAMPTWFYFALKSAHAVFATLISIVLAFVFL
jgi:hypothetical protein